MDPLSNKPTVKIATITKRMKWKKDDQKSGKCKKVWKLDDVKKLLMTSLGVTLISWLW